MSARLLFPTGSITGDIDCINISIISDNTFERDEIFLLIAIDVEDGIIFQQSSSINIVIIDDDGKIQLIAPSLPDRQIANRGLYTADFSKTCRRV